MPFRLSELALMSVTLRDVCLGIIDLTHPDTRPVNQSSRLTAAQQLHVLAYLFRVCLHSLSVCLSVCLCLSRWLIALVLSIKSNETKHYVQPKDKKQTQSNLGPDLHALPILAELHWLPIKHRTDYKIAVTVFKVLTTQQPSYLANIIRFRAASRQLRSCGRNLLHDGRTI